MNPSSLYKQIFTSKFIYLFFVVQLIGNTSIAQLSYTNTSVLASGQIFKIAIVANGVYKISATALFQNCNINNAAINNIHIYGNGGAMLNEAVTNQRIDDVLEIPLEISDDGDGIFNNQDYILFYAASPHKWKPNLAQKTFSHSEHLYSDTSFYFIAINQFINKKIETSQQTATANLLVNSFTDTYFYDEAKVNFLNSGKQWFGQELSNSNGNSTKKNYAIAWQNALANSPIKITSSFASRSIGKNESAIVLANNTPVITHNFNGVLGGYLDVFANIATDTGSINTTIANNFVSIEYQFSANNSTAKGWIDWFEIEGQKKLEIFNNQQLLFNNLASTGSNNIANFVIANSTPNTKIWKVTNNVFPINIASNFANNSTNFIDSAQQFQQYIAFETANALQPIFGSKVPNQNLHGLGFANEIIITNPMFLEAANRLANFHKQQYNITSHVVNVNEIYNEFASGVKDVTAIRDFVNMLFQKAANDTFKTPKYLLLFGSASFDFKNNGIPNLIPSYQSSNSVNPLLTYVSDDFFAYLQLGSNINNNTQVNLMDIAVGRLPIKNIDEANNIVDKIIAYHNPQNFGNWQNKFCIVADDKDNNLHLQNAEDIVATTNFLDSNILINKIYLDAHTPQINASGASYPTVNNNIVEALNSGCLLFNYVGHGSSERLAEEAVFTNTEFNNLQNSKTLPVFITATCDFAPFDNPTKKALGIDLLTKTKNGAIALLTTTRVVYSNSNKQLHTNFLESVFTKQNNSFISIGNAAKLAKNKATINNGDIINIRKFALLGDLVSAIGIPNLQANITTLNGNLLQPNDSLHPLIPYNFGGTITKFDGTIDTNFNGVVGISILAPSQTLQTKANFAQSIATSFLSQNNILFSGKATVQKGNFILQTILPKDVYSSNYPLKISLLANSTYKSASGSYNNLFIKNNYQKSQDTLGPNINLFLNDFQFVDGGLTNENPMLIVFASDSSGINASGLGIGHNIILIIDEKERQPIVLNSYFETLLNNYKNGSIYFKLPTLGNGNHSIKVKAWDIANNSSIKQLNFVVANSEHLQISKVYTYPNPLINRANFWFNHNLPNENIAITVNIYTVLGKLVHQIKQTINTVGTINSEIFWDGTDKNHNKLASGVYIYTIIANTKNSSIRKTNKLYLL
jgi:Peptidase family C25